MIFVHLTGADLSAIWDSIPPIYFWLPIPTLAGLLALLGWWLHLRALKREYRAWLARQPYRQDDPAKTPRRVSDAIIQGE